MEKFKQRASKGGILFTKGGANSVTVQSYLEEWIKEQVYGIQKEFASKYTLKGLTMEDAAIDFAIEQLGLPFVMKNEKHFQDEYFTGTPDIIIENGNSDGQGEIIDIKCSFDAFTFPLFVNSIFDAKGKILTKYRLYYTQLQIYMHLTGKRKARLCYVLMNTPDNIEPWKDKHDYTSVSPDYRIKTFSFDYNPEWIMQAQKFVRDSRAKIDELLGMIK